MCTKGNRFHFARGKSAARRSMLIVCGAVSAAAMLSFMAPSVQAQSLNTWLGGGVDDNWSTGGNWLSGSAPTMSATGDADLEFDDPGTYTSNNDLGPFLVYDTTFDAGNGPTTLTGGDLDLSWPLSENNNPAFTDNSTNPVTINNNVTFEAPSGVGGTHEYFVLAPGATSTFNGTINLSGGSNLQMTNGEAHGPVGGNLGGPGGTMIWSQPLTFANIGNYGNYFAFRIYEGTFEMGGYTIDDGSSDAPIINIDGVNLFQTSGVNNGIQTDVYIGPEDYENGDTNDVASFYLIAGGESMNARVEVGDAGTITVGGLNTSGTVYFNSFFNTLPFDGDGIIDGKSQTIYYSAAAGGTVVQNFQLISGLATEPCEANIDKVGAGTWIVNAVGTSPSGEQAYNGSTTVRDGTLELEVDDTATNYVTLPAAVYANPQSTFFANGDDGGSLGYNVATDAVQLGDSGTLPTDNIALLTLNGAGGPRMVLHYIDVNADNPAGTTTIGVGDNGTADFQGNILLNESVILTGGSGGVANFSGNITGVGGITAGGSGTVDLTGANIYGGGTKVTSGATLLIAAAGALPASSKVSVTGGTLQLGASTGVETLSSLSITGGGIFDVNNNHIIISYLPGTQATADALIRGYLVSGYAGGAWNGPGLDSSAANALFVSGNKHYGLGYADGADMNGSSPLVVGLGAGNIEVKYTLYGDANLDGVVNGTDFGILAAHFGDQVTAWDEGDFNYDGVVNGSDFGALAANFGQQANGTAIQLPAADYAALDAFAAANGLLADVPEPGTLSLLSLGALGLLRRRRRV
jgi:hypothetical protein